ncbi:MAG: hypothetical protein JNJ73_01535 [Hyphomonadaceae bacterium]|nr:hypothetical protein [Hyphomonadaceae bacterium]
MTARAWCMAFALAAFAGACDRGGGGETPAAPEANPEMQAPAPESAPGRRYRASSETARATTGRLVVTLTTRMPDAAAKETQASEILSLRGETGLLMEGALEGSIGPAVAVEGQTIRSLMDLPVEASRVLVYRVVEETAPEGGQRFCGARPTSRVLVWEPEGPVQEELRLLTLSGDPPGQAGAQLCMALAYERAEAN